jgi:cbb3-type cytochrome oxidase subunit 3
MNCYTHHEKNAVGICKSCGRGLCPDCVVEVGDGISCAGRCEEKVQIINRMVEGNARVLSTSNQSLRTAAFFILILGVAFLVFGVWQYSSDSDFLAAFLIVFGLVFLAYGLVRLRKSAQYPVVDSPDSNR